MKIHVFMRVEKARWGTFLLLIIQRLRVGANKAEIEIVVERGQNHEKFNVGEKFVTRGWEFCELPYHI